MKWTSLALVCLCLFPAAVSAQTTTLRPYEPVEGSLDGDSVSYSFTGRTGEPLSFRVTATSGDLDPVLTIRGTSGQVVISNDDYDYPENTDALLQAVTIPDFGTYTAVVSAFGDTAGGFTLTMLPGYALAWPHDDPTQTPGWTVGETALEESEDGLTFGPSEGNLAVALNPDVMPPADFFGQAQVQNLSGSDWSTGLAARVQSAQEYVLFLVNGRGEWRFSVQTPEGERVIRDWTRHPNIRADLASFTVGMLAAGSSYDLFFNGNILGRISDSTYTDAGELGLVVGRTRSTAQVSGRFNNLSATIPDISEQGPLITQPLLLGTGNAMVIDLQRRMLIPGTGQLVLNLPESFSQYTRPGVNTIGLASNLTFSDFAMGTTVYADSVTGALGGCGLILRMSEPTRYVLAFIDGKGGYGMSQREGDTFSEGIYAESPNWSNTTGHHLLVTAVGPELHYYVDGIYAGTLETDLLSGGVGNAVVNFESADTSCRFQNTWLWRSDEPTGS
jgi:hypothetical protein